MKLVLVVLLAVLFQCKSELTDDDANCPPELSAIGNNVFSFTNATTNMTVQFMLCGTFSNGCSAPGSGACTVPGCCSVCQRWIESGSQVPGAACLGYFTSYTVERGPFGELLVLNYTGGDEVVGSDPGSRETLISLNCNILYSNVGNIKYYDAATQPRDGTKYQYKLTAQLASLCPPSPPGPEPLGGGFVFLVVLVILLTIGVIAVVIWRFSRRNTYAST